VIGPATNGLDALGDMLSPIIGYNPFELKETIRKEITDFMAEMGVEDPVAWTSLIMKGAFREATGLSVEQRTALDWPNTDMLTGNVLDALGPFGGLIGGGIQDAIGYKAQGNDAMAMASLMPLAFRNAVKAIQNRGEFFGMDFGLPPGGIGVPSPKTGNSPVVPGELGGVDSAKMLIGFTPSKLADIREQARRVSKPSGMAKARDSLADELSQILGAQIASEKGGREDLAQKFREQYKKRVEAAMDQDLDQTDPRKRLVNDWGDFYKNRVLTRVARNFIEGPLGKEAMKHVPKAERPFVQEDLEKYYKRKSQ
jgi:hypothetical protein